MTYLVICSISLLASGLTFFSGFGLGTLLLPAFAFFFPVDQAIALTGIVHFLNGLFKLLLVGRHANLKIVLRFGIPAITGAIVGAWLLLWLSDGEPLFTGELLGYRVQVTPIKLLIGILLIVFALIEVIPVLRTKTFGPQYLVVGGILSGFFGGLSGLQGALRTAFLARTGLEKESFVATGVVIGVLVDFTRLGVYSMAIYKVADQLDYSLLIAAVLAAFVGAIFGNYYLKKITMNSIQKLVAFLLLVTGIGLILGWV